MFAPPPSDAVPAGPPWVVALIDDEPGVHEVSRLVLRRLRFDGRPLEILSAFSAREGQRLFEERDDIAVALVDVVMEHDRAGLDLVRHLRDALGNKLTRVILRTGQPGTAPEREIVTHFEIDDYKDKAELTADRLYTAVFASLRSYQALWSLEQTRQGLARIAEAAARLMGHDDTAVFLVEALKEMAGMAALAAGPGTTGSHGLAAADLPDGLAVVIEDEGLGSAQGGALPAGDAGPQPRALVLSGTGAFAGRAGSALGPLVAPDLGQRIQTMAHAGAGMTQDHEGVLLGLDVGHRRHCALWVRCATASGREVSALWQVFAARLHDVTRARRAVEARAEVAAAERELRAKSRFMSRMSHELRTPLNAVLGFAQLMMADAHESALRRERLGHITAAGQHLLALVDDILELSRLEGGELAIRLEPVPLASVLAQVLPLVAPQAQARAISLTAEATQAVVMADATRLRQVLLNLLTNAIKYNRPLGTVQVRVEEDGASKGGHLRVQVIDSGHGMSSAQLRQLFQPFNRLGAERSGVEGTGIGLTIVKGLVERMGGTITAHSVLGEGSTFTVSLPKGVAPHAPSQADGAEVAAPTHRVADGAYASAAAQPARVLYIEDNPVIAMIVSELLKPRADIALWRAEDGEQGIALARSVLPDLVLLDMQLPDMNGLEVLAQLRADERTASMPCVALSANALPADVDQALASGFAAYMAKPFDFDAFIDMIDRHLQAAR